MLGIKSSILTSGKKFHGRRALSATARERQTKERDQKPMSLLQRGVLFVLGAGAKKVLSVLRVFAGVAGNGKRARAGVRPLVPLQRAPSLQAASPACGPLFFLPCAQLVCQKTSVCRLATGAPVNGDFSLPKGKLVILQHRQAGWLSPAIGSPLVTKFGPRHLNQSWGALRESGRS
jgi:hypothetical protein